MFIHTRKYRLPILLGLMVWLAAWPLHTHAVIEQTAIERSAEALVEMNLLHGKLNGDLALHDSITRAEFVTFIVSAYGKAEDAVKSKGVAAFPDTAQHWASGYIAVGKQMMEANGEIVGKPDGSFAPDGKLTAAESIAFLMKFLNMKPESSSKWPDNYMNSAVAAGLVSEMAQETVQAYKNTSITRGTAFYLLDQAFTNYLLPSGLNFYETHGLTTSKPDDTDDPETPDPNMNLPLSSPPPASSIHVWNYYALTDEVRVSVNIPATSVQVYADEDGKQLLGKSSTISTGSTTNSGGARAANVHTVIVPIEKGLTSGNLYITVTEPNKRESRMTSVTVNSHPEQPELKDITHTKYTMFVSHAPESGYVLIYDSLDAKHYLGRGDNSKKNAKAQTEAFLYDGSPFSSKDHWYIAYYSNGAESQRVQVMMGDEQ